MDSLAGVAPRRKDSENQIVQYSDVVLYIDGAQWLTQVGQKSAVECKGKSQPDWVVNKMQLRVEIQA